MDKRKQAQRLTLGVLTALVIAVGIALWPAKESPQPDQPIASTPATTPSTSAEPLPADLRENPVVQAYQAFTDFQQHSRGFFDNAERLSEQEKQAQLRQLLDGTNQYEQQGKLVPMEALILKLAMLRYTSSGDDDYKAKAKGLIDQYKAQSDLREQAWLANPDPNFVDYKRQEADIVKEVTAMTVIPDGLSRDEYLRQRLEQARIATMGGSGP